MKGLWFGVVLTVGSTLAAPCDDSKQIDVMTDNGVRAMRLPPAKVDPVIIDGIYYAPYFGMESEDGQVGGLLGAFSATKQRLWTLKVYDNVRDEDLEGDVQDIFFKAMTLDPDGRLRIVNEDGYTFLVDVKTRSVTALPKPLAKYTEEGELIIRPKKPRG